MAGLVNEARLNMILAADDQAGKVLSDLAGIVERVQASIRTLAEEAQGSLGDLKDAFTGVAGSVDTAKQSVQQFGDTWQGVFGSLPASADAVRGALDGVQLAVSTTSGQLQTLGDDGRTALDSVQTSAQAAASEISDGLDAAATAAKGSLDELGTQGADALDSVQKAVQGVAEDLNTTLDDAVNTAKGDFQEMTDQATQGLKEVQAQAEETANVVKKATGGGAQASPWGAAGKLGTDLTGMFHGIASGAMGTGMNLWMGSMALQMLGQSGMGLANLQAIMQMGGPNTSPQAAEQYAALLGMAGIAPGEAPGFMSGLTGRLQSLFTVTGTSGFSRQALLALQNAGYSLPQLMTASPINQLSDIASVYQKLMSGGQSQAGAALLSQLGLSQFGGIFSNWSTVQGQLQGFDLGLSKQQIAQGSQQGITLQASLVKLQMTFSTLAAELAPAAQKLVKAIQDLVNVFTGPGSGLSKIHEGFQTLGRDLGPVAEGIAALWAVLKIAGLVKGGITIGQDIASLIAALKRRGTGGGSGGGMLPPGGGLGGGGCLNICQDSIAQFGEATAGAMAPIMGRAGSFSTGAIGAVAFGGILASLPLLDQALRNLQQPVQGLTPALQQATSSAQQMGVEVPAYGVQMRDNMDADMQQMATQTNATMRSWSTQAEQSVNLFNIQSQAALRTFTAEGTGLLRSWAPQATQAITQFGTQTQDSIKSSMTASQAAISSGMASTQATVQSAMKSVTDNINSMESTTTKSLNDWQSEATGDVNDFASNAKRVLGDFVTAAAGTLKTWDDTAKGAISDFATAAGQVLQQWASEATAIVLGFATSMVQTMLQAQVSIGEAQGQTVSPGGTTWSVWQAQQMQNFLGALGLSSGREPNPWGIGQSGTAQASGANSGNSEISPILTGQLPPSFSSTSGSNLWLILQGLYAQATQPGMPASGIGGILGALGIGGIGSLFSGLFGGGTAEAGGLSGLQPAVMPSPAIGQAIQQAMQVTGVPSTWLSPLEQLAYRESGYNPANVSGVAINPTTGAYESVSQGGQEATGLFQMLPSTFAGSAMTGYGNITNALDNAVAAIRYIQGRYGDIFSMMNSTGPNPKGSANPFASGYTGYASGGLLSEPVLGIGMDTGTRYMFGEDGPEYFIPAVGSRAGLGGGAAHGGGGAGEMNVTITVNAPGNAALNRQFAQQIGQEIVRNLKFRGNYFDMANA